MSGIAGDPCKTWAGYHMAYRVCSTPGCPTLHQGTGRCPSCAVKADKARRPDGNPYSNAAHRKGFREGVLTRDPVCMVCRVALSTVADHWPVERADLITQGLDPNDPKRGRGLCKPCHDRHTATTHGFGR